MRRRVARVLRWGLFVLGITFALWIPISFTYAAACTTPSGGVWVVTGAVDVYVQPNRWVGVDAAVWKARGDDHERAWASYFLPEVSRPPFTNDLVISIPLWLLAFICLAWPVTSFIIARRRHKRGFPVSVAPLPLGEVPSESASEAERASWK